MTDHCAGRDGSAPDASAGGSTRRPIRALGLALALLILAACNGDPDPATTPTATGAGPPPAAEEGYFPAVWPVGDAGEARALQQSVDGGEEPWRLDPVETARQYARQLASWEIRVESSDRRGSPEQGWTATVAFQPLIGENEPPDFPGPRHELTLVGLQGAEDPVWFVTGLQSDEITIESPEHGDVVTSPLGLSGRGRAYEGTIHVSIRDDREVDLHPRPGDPGFVTAGALEVQPFEASLDFSAPSARAGRLMLAGDTGAGPPPAIAVVRIRFEE